MKKTATEAILEALKNSPKPLAIWEMGIVGHSQTALSARTREMARLGLIAGQRREGFAYKEWQICQPGQVLSAGNDIESGTNAARLAPVFFTETDNQMEFRTEGI